MSTLSAWDLLALWEQGYGYAPVQKALFLIAAAWPDISIDQAAALPIGKRDGYLLSIREHLFGTRLESVVYCPECGERLEISFHTSDIRTNGQETSEPLSLKIDDYQIHFRLPNSQDLLTIDASQDQFQNQLHLLEQCLIDVKHQGKAVTTTQLPPHVIKDITRQMAVTDPQADIQLQLDCPACTLQWSAVFDIISFLWEELHEWAIRTLREVHELAAAYSWSEREILSMSAWRRQLYLQMTV